MRMLACMFAGLVVLAAPGTVRAQSCDLDPGRVEALDLAGLELDRSGQIALHFDLADWHAECGDIARARIAYQTARTLIAASDTVEGAWAHGLIGEARLEMSQGRFDRAREILDDAYAVLEEAGAARARDFLYLMETALAVEAAASAAGETHDLPGAQAELAVLRARVAREDEEALTRDPAAGADADHVIVPVFYGTNRVRTGSEDPNAFYGVTPAMLDLGVVTVSVPRNRDIGTIPRRSDYPGDLDQYRGEYFILERVEPFADDYAFTDALGEAMDASERRELLVFIHGFNSDFRGAAERAAQLAVDLEIDGVPALYSWPSRASLLGYFADGREVNEDNIRDLVDYLYLLMNGANAHRIHIVAHSMGNRFLARALERFAQAYPSPPEPLFDQVVWASPDVDAEEFMALIPQIGHLASGMTLYASSRDRALRLSRRINGGNPRAGDSSPPYPVVVAGLSTIDTSAAGGAGLGHSDYAGPAMDDFRALIWLSLSPEERCILHTNTGQFGQFYAVDPFTGGQCEPDVFKYSITALRRSGEDGEPLEMLQSVAALPGAAIAGRVEDVRQLIVRLTGG
ncbi:alpha/beta hydrolase [Glycocaulis abyssi]|uniref:Alpha/beta hydrolase n=1 Tax=Glycocaulis abyssi TaxID=1433403 RepID=A0ABV9NEP2_9PROT